MQAEVRFKIASWDENPFDEPESGPKLTRARMCNGHSMAT